MISRHTGSNSTAREGHRHREVLSDVQRGVRRLSGPAEPAGELAVGSPERSGVAPAGARLQVAAGPLPRPFRLPITRLAHEHAHAQRPSEAFNGGVSLGRPLWHDTSAATLSDTPLRGIPPIGQAGKVTVEGVVRLAGRDRPGGDPLRGARHATSTRQRRRLAVPAREPRRREPRPHCGSSPGRSAGTNRVRTSRTRSFDTVSGRSTRSAQQSPSPAWRRRRQRRIFGSVASTADGLGARLDTASPTATPSDPVVPTPDAGRSSSGTPSAR